MAQRAGELIPLARFHPSVLAWVAERSQAEIWTVALSGGPDSVALLLLLCAHWPARREKLVAVHFNHRLRGRESLADEKFCRRLCAALRIRIRVGRWPGRHLDASEAEARAMRHDFFGSEMKRCGSRALWFAHQQDDIAETILMRLARGSGAGGLAAPRPVQLVGSQRTHLRPLLTLKKAELTAALREVGAAWREDSSNAGSRYFRNRIRAKVLSSWTKAAERDALAGAARSRELLEEDDDALEEWTQKLTTWGQPRRILLRNLIGVPRAVKRRILHRWLLAVRPDTDLSRQGFELLLSALDVGKSTRFSLGARDFAVIRQGELLLKRG